MKTKAIQFKGTCVGCDADHDGTCRGAAFTRAAWGFRGRQVLLPSWSMVVQPWPGSRRQRRQRMASGPPMRRVVTRPPRRAGRS